MRFAVAALALLLSLPAQAGGVGLILTGGAHTEQMWYHSNLISRDGGEGVEVSNPRDFEKYELVQTLPHAGAGLEVLLGDRDDRITGVFRFYYMQDAPQVDPAAVTTLVPAANVIAAYRDKPRHVGIGLVGLNFGILGQPDGFQAGIATHVGSGFLTSDHTEFFLADVGPMVTYKFTRQMFAFGEVAYQMRFRKGWSNGLNATAGVRYMFD